MADQITIRGDVPIDWHPDALLNIGKVLDREGTHGRGAYVSARDALGALYTTAGMIADARKAIHASVPPASWRPGQPVPAGWRLGPGGTMQAVTGREGEFAAAAQQAFDRAAGRVDKRLAEVRAIDARLAEQLRGAVHKPEDARPEAVAQAGEIRAFMKAQKTKAILAVMAAIEAGDRQTVAAVLSAPAYLSGLDTRQAVAVRQLAERQFAPVESEQRAAVADLAERLVGAASSFAGHFKEMVAPPDPAVVAADARIGELANG